MVEAVEVDVDGFVPVLVGHLEDGGGAGLAGEGGVVHEDVDLPQLGHGRIDSALEVVLVGHVAVDGKGAAAHAAHFLSDALDAFPAHLLLVCGEGGGVAGARGDNDIGPLLGETQDDGASDAAVASSAGYEGDTAFEPSHRTARR